MGRRKKYITEEQKKTANNEKVKDFYWHNKEIMDLKAKAYYWKKKIKIHIENDNIIDAKLVIEKAVNSGIPRDMIDVELPE